MNDYTPASAWAWTGACPFNDELSGNAVTNPATVTHSVFTPASEWAEGCESHNTTTEQLWMFSLNHIVDVDKAAIAWTIPVLGSFYDYLGPPRRHEVQGADRSDRLPM